MVTGRARIASLEAGQLLLADAGRAAGTVLSVPVRGSVPAWLSELVSAASACGASVVVEAEPPADLAGEALDGWEIGVATAAVAAGAEVAGIDPRRVARVQEVASSLAAALPERSPETAS